MHPEMPQVVHTLVHMAQIYCGSEGVAPRDTPTGSGSCHEEYTKLIEVTGRPQDFVLHFKVSASLLPVRIDT